MVGVGEEGFTRLKVGEFEGSDGEGRTVGFEDGLRRW